MAAAPANLLDDSASDYDSDVLAYHPAVPPTATRGSISRALTTGFKTGSGLYDPKAAEFNQYLLEQQELMASPPVENAGVTATMSDDEDYFAAPTGSSTGLTRSRSCMLGPNSSGAGGSGNQAKQAKYNLSEGSSKVKDQRKLSSWEGQNSAGRTAMG